MPDPCRALLRLPPTSDAPARARAGLAELCDALPATALDEALLLTSELVTNAALHGRGMITVSLESDGGWVSVAVADSSPRWPCRRRDDMEADGGRGMHLVEALAAQWGIQPGPDGGKVVWFRTSIAPRHAGVG